ncbi:MAG: DNA-binding transcriptional regulator [Bacteroidota bacterium]|nr:DNA-binding transcriptional regulator [Bacteroidota bacterium]
MLRLLFISDFTEQFAYNLLKGIMLFSRETEPWVVWKMPPSTKRKLGIPGVVDWAVRWKADIVIGQFEPDEDVSLFSSKGIVVLAQDYKMRFRNCPNITADYLKTGRMAADYYLEKGFRYFAFFGYKDACWSYERYLGFRHRVEEAGYGESFYLYDTQNIDNLWFFESEKIADWLKSLPKPIAIFACDDNQAALLLEAANASGVEVPMDVSVLGVDNDEVLCNLTNPSLSSIKVDIVNGGYMAASQAIEMINDRKFTGPDIIMQPVGVVSRDSTSLFATTDTLVIKALDFIKTNASKHINVTDVLKVVPLSRRLLEIRFKNVTGMTIYSYITLLRINMFAKMLVATKDTVNEIAMALDEPDVKSISRRFKTLKGCTPSEYRELYYANCE